MIRDQHFQTKNLQVTVEDTILELSHEVLELMSSNSEYISARESYQGIKNFTKSNDNIRVIKKILENGQEVLEIFPIKSGETNLLVYDNQDNVDSVRVVVGGGSGNGDNIGNETPSEESLPANTLLKNGNMTGTGGHNGPGGAWLAGGNTDGWYATVIGSGKAELVDRRMKLETTENNSYIEARNTSASYHGVNDESIAVEPSTEYVLQYEYETEYLSGDSSHGFNVSILMQESSWVHAGQIESLEYVKTTRGKTKVSFPFTTSVTARYLNISPVIYSHTGNGTLQMKAWVDNISLVKKVISPEEQELEALIQEILGGIGVQNNGEDGVEINEALQGFYFYWKRERLIKKYEGTGNYNGFRGFQNKLKSTNLTVDKLNSILIKVETFKAQTQYQTERMRNFLALIEISVKSELEDRDTQVQIDEGQARADLLLIYAEMGLDMSGFISIGEGLGTVTTYWVGYIIDDPYLSQEAKLHLNEDLLAVASELNPSKKFQKLMNFGESVKVAKKISDYRRKIYGWVYRSEKEGRVIIESSNIGDPRYSGGNWEKRSYNTSNDNSSEYGKDVEIHWMQNKTNGYRDDIKIIN